MQLDHPLSLRCNLIHFTGIYAHDLGMEEKNER
jgi:hypothetical protein